MREILRALGIEERNPGAWTGGPLPGRGAVTLASVSPGTGASLGGVAEAHAEEYEQVVRGQGMALVFGLIGLFSNPFLLFIAFLVWIGATQEASLVQMKTALGGIPVSRAMVTNFETVPESATLGTAIDVLLRGAQEDFPVMR